MPLYTVEFKLMAEWKPENKEPVDLLTARNMVMGSIAAAKPDEVHADISRYSLVSTDGEHISHREFPIMFAMLEFPNEFGLLAFPGDKFRISQRSSYLSEGKVMLYTERFCEDGKWHSFAKGTPRELKREVVPV